MATKLILFAFLAVSLLLTVGCVAPQDTVAAPVAESAEPPVELAQIGQRCFPAAALLRGLLQDHGEAMQGVGHVPVPAGSPPVVVSLLVSPSGSWSIVASSSRGVACLIVWGGEWSPPPKEGRNT